MKNLLMIGLLLILAACATPAKLEPAPAPSPQPQPTPVGTPVGTPVSQVIGTAGGTLASADGRMRVEIPAGALAKDETVSVQEITNNAPGGFGKAFRLSPEGTAFAKPVRLTFALSEDQLKAAPLEAMQVGHQEGGYWKAAKVVGRDDAARTVTAETDHFSDWSAVPGVQLDPGMAHVKEGGTVSLRVILCDSATPGPLEGTFTCASNVVASHQARNWSVNGAPGGSAAFGTVASDAPGQALYQAPAQRPRPSTVAVAVQINGLDGSLLTLVANVLIGNNEADWQGTITYAESGSRVLPARDGFAGSIEDKFTMRQTFTVVGVKETEGPITTLLLRQVGSAATTRQGSYRRELYLICQALGPVILRYLDEYAVNLSLKGAVDATLEARLYRGADGGYNMYFSPTEIQSTGTEAVTDIHKEFCFNTTDDDSYTRELKRTDNAHTDIGVVGVGPDPADPNRLTGGYEGKGRGGLLEVPTTWSVKWNLARVPKP